MKQFVSDLRRDQPPSSRIGVTGYCWGAYGATRMASGKDTTPDGRPLIDAVYTAHPSEVKVDDFRDIQVPYSMVIGDVDFAMDIKQVKQVAEILEQNTKVASEVVVIPGARHGFSVRGNPDDPVEKEMADQAEDQVVRWFAKYL